MIDLARERLRRPGIVLRHGTGTGEPGDACLIQEERRCLRDAALELGAVEFVDDYDPRTDACPPCTSPLCRAFGIQIQDAREDWRRECVTLLPLLPGSAGSAALEERRGWRLLDWSVREALPACVDVLAAALEPHDAALAEELSAHGAQLRALSAMTDKEAARAAVEPLRVLAAPALALDLVRALDLALDLDLVRALDLALDLDLDLDLPSPVALLKELLEMRDDVGVRGEPCACGPIGASEAGR